MQTAAHIGGTIVIKGDVTAHEDVIIAGRVDGTVRIEGHTLTIAPGAEVVADLHAAEVIIQGRVLGAVTADRRVVVGAPADIEGEIAAPAVAVAEGATVSGHIETTAARKPALQLAS